MARHSKKAAPSGTRTRLPGVLGKGRNAYNHATGVPREDTWLGKLRRGASPCYHSLWSCFWDTLSLVPLQAEQEAPHEGGIHKSQTSFLSLLVIGYFSLTP